MTAPELKEKFVDFFHSKNHREIPSSRLIPENDPTTLFISAGMHPLVPYLLGQPHPLGKRLVNVQKCVRTGDIDEVGDTYHHTFFEMLGNWSLGDYSKENMIPWSYQFLTQVLNLDPKNLHITCFAGDDTAPKDTASHDLWLSLGIPEDRIHYLPKKDNWWGPASATGPCGPDTEMFIDLCPQLPQVDFITGCHQDRYREIWNDVFMEYNKTADGQYLKLSQQNVDTGLGVERAVAILSGQTDHYLTPIWRPIIKKIEELSKLLYGDQSDDFYIKDNKQCWVDVRRSMRIIADHLRSAVFIIADGVEPSNKEAGYVLRRLIRRAIRQGKILGININFCSQIAQAVLDNQKNYAGTYPELDQSRDKIISLIDNEEIKFRQTLDKGLREINKLINRSPPATCKDAFTLYESFGFPYEMIVEEFAKNNITLDSREFEKYRSDHQQKSRTLSAGKFKSGLADHSEIITKYHTATHLLHAALREKIDPHISQCGSNITHERLRFDFNYPQKLSDSQIKLVEDRVNQIIQLKISIVCEVLPLKTAISSGATALFGNKYPDTVTVYGTAPLNFSREICTGPHVTNSQELGLFKIIKEESAGSGKRRLYAILK